MELQRQLAEELTQRQVMPSTQWSRKRNREDTHEGEHWCFLGGQALTDLLRSQEISGFLKDLFDLC